MSPTAAIDRRANDRPDLGSRVESCVARLLSDRLGADADVRTFNGDLGKDVNGNQLPVGASWYQVRATRNAERPVNTGIYSLTVEIIAHGDVMQEKADIIETLFASARHMDCAIRQLAIDAGFIMPMGRAVSFDDLQAERSGVGQDLELRWAFNLHAQALEFSKAA